MTTGKQRRVVITGMGTVCPLGLTLEDVWAGLLAGTSAMGPLESFPAEGLPLHYAAEARCFTGEIDNFGPLDAEKKKAIRKGLKVMCRESQMAVAAAQRALYGCGLGADQHQPERFGCVFGSDYMLTLPEDFTAGVAKCRNASGDFDFQRWAVDGMPQLTPLWLLKYLPNMPASHIAIYNDLRGPSNSITVREASGHLAIGEATVTIQRGAADMMLAGATGTRVHPMKTVHCLQSEQVALGNGLLENVPPAGWSRPFDKARQGMVLGEGAAMLKAPAPWPETARRRWHCTNAWGMWPTQFPPWQPPAISAISGRPAGLWSASPACGRCGTRRSFPCSISQPPIRSAPSAPHGLAIPLATCSSPRP